MVGREGRQREGEKRQAGSGRPYEGDTNVFFKVKFENHSRTDNEERPRMLRTQGKGKWGSKGDMDTRAATEKRTRTSSHTKAPSGPLLLSLAIVMGHEGLRG